MKFISITLIKITLGFLFWIVPNIPSGHGYKDFGEDCDPKQSQIEPKNQCDASRGLFCNHVQKECRCVISGAYYQMGRCRARINKPCGLMDGFQMGCVKNAACHETSRICQCSSAELFSNEDGTACTTNSGGLGLFTPTQIPWISTLAILVLILAN